MGAHDFNQADVARAVGVPYTTLDRWMRELGVVRPRDLRDDEIDAARRATGGDIAQMAKMLRVSVRGLRSRVG